MEIALLLLQLFGGMGVFLVGMNLMSDNMSHLAHGKLRAMLNKTTNNRLAGVGIGAGVTAIIQSSAATTVMVVGLVNAGVMTLFQATSVIMGANIGTTITAHIATLGSIPIAEFFFLFGIVGVFMTMLGKTEKIKVLGNIFSGVGLIFVGLNVMTSTLSGENEQVFGAMKSVLEFVKNPILLVLIGAVLTGVIQSSSVITSLIIILAASGMYIGGAGTDGAYFVIIGSNIGTCVTALISSIGANVNARRASLIHLLFNCFGAVIFITFLLLWSLTGTTFSGSVLNVLVPGVIETQIALFHTFFNVVCTCLFLPFSKYFVKIAERLIREKEEGKAQKEDNELLALLDERLLKNPSVALGYLYENTGKVLTFAMDTLSRAVNAFLEKNVSEKEKVLAMNEDLVQINKQSVDYLVKISSNSISMTDEKTVSALHDVLGDIVRIGEIADNVTKYTDYYVNQNLTFSEEFLTMVKAMFEKVKSLQEVTLEAFLKKDEAMLVTVDGIEDEIDKARQTLFADHLMRLKEGKCQPENSNTFINLVGNLERAADHVTYIAHSIEAV